MPAPRTNTKGTAMSAPDTNTEKQAEKHKAPLGGMAIAVGGAVLLLILLIIFLIFSGNDPEGANTQVDGRTGDVEATAPAATN